MLDAADDAGDGGRRRRRAASTGTGNVLVVEHTSDNTLVTFRFKNTDVKMPAAEDDFELGGHKFRAGRDRRSRTPTARSSSRCSRSSACRRGRWRRRRACKTHDLDVPRIGYIHSWTRTQDEGWVRAALDTYGVPYTYFGDQKLREGNLRSKYDVLIFPHVGGSAVVAGERRCRRPAARRCRTRRRRSSRTSAYVDSTDDIRGGMGIEGLVELTKFVQEGGTLITEGSTATIFPEYGITPASPSRSRRSCSCAGRSCAR